MPRPPATRQFELFSSPAVEGVSVPPWQAPPEETRRRLTRLMVRLILDHVDGDRAEQRKGVGHDA